QQTAQGTDETQNREERHPSDRRCRPAISREREYEAQDEPVKGAGNHGGRSVRSVAQSKRREPPEHERPPLKGEAMRRGPSEKKRECAGSSEPWHCLQWCRLTDRAEAAGDSPAGARVWDEVRAPPGAQHSASIRAISARLFHALVRQQRGATSVSDGGRRVPQRRQGPRQLQSSRQLRRGSQALARQRLLALQQR